MLPMLQPEILMFSLYHRLRLSTAFPYLQVFHTDIHSQPPTEGNLTSPYNHAILNTTVGPGGLSKCSGTGMLGWDAGPLWVPGRPIQPRYREYNAGARRHVVARGCRDAMRGPCGCQSAPYNHRMTDTTVGPGGLSKCSGTGMLCMEYPPRDPCNVPTS